MIRRILVANRGEIARRVFRTCRNLRLETVAVYSDGDSDAPHRREADIAVPLYGLTAAETYLDHKKVIEAAIASGADAIHPGYGFLSENAAFAAAVVDAGLTWIGPSPEAIASMGSKIEAKSIMKEAGVPCLPDADLRGLDTDDVAAAAGDIGYPVLVKASAGGGGKGMRIVHRESDLEEAVQGATREAESAFGDGTIFLEKYLTGPRHIEVQIVADVHGNVVSLHERDCSVQRRHQKIIEECPSPVITPELRAQMSDAAVLAARSVDYIGAGTVEFLYQDGEFYFLEMNTRLQVEHPVTEMVTGLDLVELQIAVANGSPLPDAAHNPPLIGHAIEARLYAEDPASGFLPVTGAIHAFDFPIEEGVRVDSGVEAGSTVSVHFDPMLAKVIAHGEDRLASAAAIASVLRRARIHSSTTNRDLLVRILEHEDFLAGSADTGFLDRIDVEAMSSPLVPQVEFPVYAAAAALADRAHRAAASSTPETLAGFRNVGVDRQRIELSISDQIIPVVYEIRRGGVRLVEPADVVALDHEPGRARIEQNGRVFDLQVARYGDLRFVGSDEGTVRFATRPRFPAAVVTDTPGSLHAPMPGRIVRVGVAEGDEVDDGDALVVLEAMKMEHTLRAPHAGVISRLNCKVGDQVEADDVLIVVD